MRKRFALEAAEDVRYRLSGVGSEAIESLHSAPYTLEVLASLVAKSLVVREADDEGGYRFRLLESMLLGSRNMPDPRRIDPVRCPPRELWHGMPAP